MDFFEKLYIARTLLSLNQKEAARQAGVSPVTISILERGERSALPGAYAAFLYKNGIDLNWIFNKDDNEGNVFRKEENIHENNNESADRLDQSAGKNIFISRELLETKHVTYTLIKYLDKLHNELSEMKKLNKLLYIRSKEANPFKSKIRQKRSKAVRKTIH